MLKSALLAYISDQFRTTFIDRREVRDSNFGHLAEFRLLLVLARVKSILKCIVVVFLYRLHSLWLWLRDYYLRCHVALIVYEGTVPDNSTGPERLLRHVL